MVVQFAKVPKSFMYSMIDGTYIEPWDSYHVTLRNFYQTFICIVRCKEPSLGIHHAIDLLFNQISLQTMKTKKIYIKRTKIARVSFKTHHPIVLIMKKMRKKNEEKTTWSTHETNPKKGRGTFPVGNPYSSPDNRRLSHNSWSRLKCRRL